jgi:hypothetical protein
MKKTYYVTRDKKILIQSIDKEVIERFTNDIRVEAEKEFNQDLGFTVYLKEDETVYHYYHTWLSSGDGYMHSRRFSPRREVTESFNKDYV